MKKNGFSFIEILVVVTIIAILMAIAALSYATIQKRSRDSRRKSDIEQIRSALQMYHADFGYFPDGGDTTFTSVANSAVISALVDGGYLPSVPTDPKNVPYQIAMTDSRGDPAHSYGYCLAALTESVGSGVVGCAVSGDAAAYTYSVKNP